MADATWSFRSGIYFGAFLLITGFIFLKFNKTQPVPYMDEVFHIPQAQKYCDGNFTEWDPMITTLPGLYLVSMGFLKPFMILGSDSSLCSTSFLRSINFLFAAGNFILLYLLNVKLNGYEKKRIELQWLTATTLALFPLLYFFTFLYYTDTGSTFFVLLMYLLYQEKQHLRATCAGFVAVMFRQTNVVWVIFMAGISAVEILQDFSGVRNAKGDSIELFKAVAVKLKNSVKYNRKPLIQLITECIRRILPYVVIVFGFAVFVYVNGSIVIGAKQDHQVGLHLPQLFYFASFLGVFLFMHLASFRNVSSFWNQFCRHPFIFIVLATFCAIIVSNFTIAHRYLLADNRHYTFYIWARLFQRHSFVKFAMIPGYMFFIYAALETLKKPLVWKVIYCVCLVANLIPATLLEFRYFILPYLIYRLNIPTVAYQRLTAELLLYVIINFVTFYLFFEKPFFWNNDPNVQRFMW